MQSETIEVTQKVDGAWKEKGFSNSLAITSSHINYLENLAGALKVNFSR
jgi:hypothetical protein